MARVQVSMDNSFDISGSGFISEDSFEDHESSIEELADQLEESEIIPSYDNADISFANDISNELDENNEEATANAQIGVEFMRSTHILTSIAADNNSLYIAGHAKIIYIFDLNNLKPRGILNTTLIIDVIDVYNDYIAIGSNTGEIQILSRLNNTLLNEFHPHTMAITALKFVANSSYSSVPLLYSTSLDGSFIAFSLENSGVLHSYQQCSCSLTSLAVVPSFPNEIFLGSSEGTVKRLNLVEKKCSLNLLAHENKPSPVRSLALLPSPMPRKRLAKKKNVGDNSEKSAPTTAATQQDNHVHLYISYGRGCLKLFDTRSALNLFDSNTISPEIISCLALENGRIFVADEANAVRVIDSKSLQLLDTLRGHSNTISSLLILRNLGVLITLSHDKTARLYNLSALESNIAVKLLQLEQGQNLAFEEFVAAKLQAKGKKKQKSSKKGKKLTKKKEKGTQEKTISPLEMQLAKGRGEQSTATAAAAAAGTSAGIKVAVTLGEKKSKPTSAKVVTSPPSNAQTAAANTNNNTAAATTNNNNSNTTLQANSEAATASIAAEKQS
jgi:WD40 repeat protein